MFKMVIVMLVVIILIVFNFDMGIKAYTNNGEEMRAVWITTVYNQDWPSASSKNNIEVQKQEFINILDELKGLGFNAVVVQVRPKGDALYKSNINPWSDVLTGTQGKDPGYDPLRFIIDEAHKRGIEIHAWLNPYRVTTSGTDINKLSDKHFARRNPHTVLQYNNALIYNPGLPEVKQHIVDTVDEIVRNYNVDAIHFDDYFYPGANINDSDAYNKYGNGMDIGDFRRKSVNEMVQAVYKRIKAINSNVRFGISPRGIWKNKSSDPTGSNTNGAQSYYDIYADTRTWIKNGWLDYVTPQLYWEIGHSAANYEVLVPWWVNEVVGTGVDLYIGQGIYKPTVSSQIDSQILLNRKYREVKGSMFFSYRDIKNNVSGIKEKIKPLYQENIPPLDYNLKGIVYQTHIQDIGWTKWKSDGEISGTQGKAKRLEAISIQLNNILPGANVEYRTHIQDIGWQQWKRNGEISGTRGLEKRLEAIEIKLIDAPEYDIEYRVHVQNEGWQPWRKNGELSGTVGLGRRLEAIEIRVLKKNVKNANYQTHIQDIGWQNYKSNGQMSGTEGKAKRLEAIKINVDELPNNSKVKYRTHVQNDGWKNWSYNGEVNGTVGQGKRLEAIQIELENTSEYSIQYRVHIQDKGWSKWVENGEIAGTYGQAKRLEAIEIRVINN